MESLYRKYRPQTFADVVGQRHVVETLERAVTENRVSHAYLFCGPRGTGKTTMARILAKALLCEQGEGHLPDGTCEQCELIASGDHPDVYELDAASRTGVDNVREEIISRVDYAPVRGRYKVYIIDEVHMLTPAAFNALLKTLEEPPSHVVFIMCTTDPQKILATILSRVQRFDFHAIGNQEMYDHLVKVCGLEGFKAEDEALDLIVRHSRGGMRDALSTLEQLSVFGNGSITADAARSLLGEVSSAGMNQISTALAVRDVATLFSEVARICDAGRDPLQFTRELASHIRDLYVASTVGANTGALNVSAEEATSLKNEAATYGGPDRLAYILTTLGDAASQMRTATNQRLALEIALTRAARPSSDLTLEALAARIEALEKGAAGAAPVAAAPAPAVIPTPAPAVAPVAAQLPTPVPTPAPESAPTPAPEPESAPTKHVGRINGELQRTWNTLIDDLKASNGSCAALLVNAYADSDDGNTLVVMLPAGSSFALRMLNRADVKMTVEAAVKKHFGPRTLSICESDSAPANAPAKVTFAHAPEEQAKPAASTPISAPEPELAPTPELEPAPEPEPAPVPTSVSEPKTAPAPAPAPQPAPVAPAPEPVEDDDDEFDPSIYDDEVPMDAYDAFDEGSSEETSGDLNDIASMFSGVFGDNTKMTVIKNNED